MDKKRSRSYILTENKIKAAATELLETYSKNEMTVSAICSKAQIPRSSFYSHYPNTTALFTTIKKENLDSIKNKFFDFNKISRKKSEIFIPLLNHMKENINLFKYVLSGFDYDYTDNNIQNTAIKYIETDQDSEDIMNRYKYIALHSALISCLRYWIENECRESSEMISEILYEYIFNNINN